MACAHLLCRSYGTSLSSFALRRLSVVGSNAEASEHGQGRGAPAKRPASSVYMQSLHSVQHSLGQSPSGLPCLRCKVQARRADRQAPRLGTSTSSGVSIGLQHASNAGMRDMTVFCSYRKGFVDETCSRRGSLSFEEDARQCDPVLVRNHVLVRLLHRPLLPATARSADGSRQGQTKRPGGVVRRSESAVFAAVLLMEVDLREWSIHTYFYRDHLAVCQEMRCMYIEECNEQKEQHDVGLSSHGKQMSNRCTRPHDGWIPHRS